ncbi:MAG: protein-methionine-sulfoxide reductase catalytic subunit MsrP [Planctomycetes bacterium]|nr:protein-methionine-sulfoxide reductase catalytic subunit MsrP [Planctomycetota bacterium]
MPTIHIRKTWDLDRSAATPEADFNGRRAFLAQVGLGGLGGLGAYGLITACRPSVADDGDVDVEDELRQTLVPPPGSAFEPGKRVAAYTLDRPLTDELTAARYNNFYEFGLNKERCWREAQRLTVRPWTIEVSGLVDKPLTLGIDDIIRKMPVEERLYRFRCVERWSMAVPWHGFSFRAFMDWVKPLSSAKFVRFVSFLRRDQAVGQRGNSGYTWPYYEGLRIDEAANELCFVATGIYGHDLPRQHGAPFRMVLPWKYGYKGAKSIVKIEFVEKQPRTFWNDQNPREYGFLSNVDPNKPHPRWSQATETMIGTNAPRPTLPYNGYGEFVAEMYKG